MDYCKYADPFYFVSNIGTAFNVDNITPNALLPFGKMSAGVHPLKFGQGEGDKILTRGVSDFYHTETENGGHYYNYAVVTPFYGEISEITKFHIAKNQDAQTGYYKMTMGDTDCEVTLSKDVIYHHCYFEKQNGRVAIDFSNDTLLKQPYVEITPLGEVLFSGTVSGEKLYFCALAECQNPKVTLFENLCETEKKSITPDTKNHFGAIFDFDGNGIILKIANSTLGFDDAKQKARSAIDSFDTVMNKAYATWGKHLSRIEIETESGEFKHKFYSAFYHILANGVDITDGSFREFENDSLTFLKQFKEIQPFIFTAYREFSSKLTQRGEICAHCGEIFAYIDKAVIHLENGNKLEIIVKKQSKESTYIDYIEFNGEKVEGNKLDFCEIVKGGELVFSIIEKD